MKTFEEILEHEIQQASDMIPAAGPGLTMFWLGRANALRFALELYRTEKEQ